MDEGIRMVLIIVKKEVDQTFQESLTNLIVAVSIFILMLLSKFLLPYIIT